jgi:hypothetical protein
METNIYDVLEENESYQETFVKHQTPPLPEAVQGWNDSLLELFCCLSVANQDNGKDLEEADRLAIEAVKRSEWFSLWINR